ncbi:MAG: peptidoglycan-associated lipoprotein [Rhizobacter sp.]|nr:peptidoglycan-associated lipoprotein [Rhizobacter sp.]
MTIPSFRFALSVLAAAAFLGGCASSVPLEGAGGAPVENRDAATANTGANAGGTSQSNVASVDLSRNSNAAMLAGLPKTVFFDYDSYVVRDDARPVVEANAKALTADRTRKAVVEGNTDERGGREYNLALGQKRAEAVVRSLVLLGATEQQLEAVSYGAERPAVTGNDESAYAKNRRAEIAYR